MPYKTLPPCTKHASIFHYGLNGCTQEHKRWKTFITNIDCLFSCSLLTLSQSWDNIDDKIILFIK